MNIYLLFLFCTFVLLNKIFLIFSWSPIADQGPGDEVNQAKIHHKNTKYYMYISGSTIHKTKDPVFISRDIYIKLIEIYV